MDYTLTIPIFFLVSPFLNVQFLLQPHPWPTESETLELWRRGPTIFKQALQVFLMQTELE